MDTPPADSELLETLQQAAADLYWVSESDYPLEGFYWENSGACDARTVVQLAQEPTDAIVETVDLDPFFAVATQPQDWYGEEELATMQKYQTLASTLKQHLIDPKVYRIGTIEVHIYIVGQTPKGNLAGLRTTAIET